MRDVGRVGIFGAERMGYICVYRNAVALQLPVAGHGYVIPAADIIVGLVEISGAVAGLLDPIELPCAIEELEVGRSLLRAC